LKKINLKKIKKLIFIFSTLFILLVFSLFATVDYEIHKNSSDYKIIGKPLYIISQVPKEAKKIIVNPKIYLTKTDSLSYTSSVQENYFGLKKNQHIDNYYGDSIKQTMIIVSGRKRGGAFLEIFNLDNLGSLFRFDLEDKDAKKILNKYLKSANSLVWDTNQLSTPKAELSHPLILGDKLIFQLPSRGPLFYINKDKKLSLFSTDDFFFHHSNEVDHEGNIWSPAYLNSYNQDHDLFGSPHQDTRNDGIVKLSPDGDILFSKSMIDIFFQNDLKSLIVGNGSKYDIDPFHLNDIQPVMQDGKYYKKGDLFLSLRNMSLILLYRPSTNKILKIIQGPFVRQHDVNVQSEHLISVFNNNNYLTYIDPFGEKQTKEGKIYNEMVTYDFNTMEFKTSHSKEMAIYQIKTGTQGRGKFFLNRKLFIEETDSGELYFFDNKDLISMYVNYNNDGNIYPLSWSRIYSQSDQDIISKFLD
jgi:hypothetical protein